MIIKNPQKNKRAFVLLYVMVLSSIVLAVALGVSNIALKELNFSTSIKDTNDAFFAADTGSECALYWDNTNSAKNAFPIDSIPAATMSCAGINPISTIYSSSGSETPTCSYLNIWSFSIPNLGNSSKACAKVIVEKGLDDNGFPCTKIISRGYNNGSSGSDNAEGSCIPTGNYTERELDVNY